MSKEKYPGIFSRLMCPIIPNNIVRHGIRQITFHTPREYNYGLFTKREFKMVCCWHIYFRFHVPKRSRGS